jgi:hypothetical protein
MRFSTHSTLEETEVLLHKQFLSWRVILLYIVNVPYSEILGNVVTVLNIVMICKSDMFKWNYSARTFVKTAVK